MSRAPTVYRTIRVDQATHERLVEYVDRENERIAPARITLGAAAAKLIRSGAEAEAGGEKG